MSMSDKQKLEKITEAEATFARGVEFLDEQLSDDWIDLERFDELASYLQDDFIDTVQSVLAS